MQESGKAIKVWNAGIVNRVTKLIICPGQNVKEYVQIAIVWIVKIVLVFAKRVKTDIF